MRKYQELLLEQIIEQVRVDKLVQMIFASMARRMEIWH